MPVGCPWRTPHNVSNRQLLWLAAFLADPARASHDLEQLPVLVVVPVCTSGRREEDVLDGNCRIAVSEVHEH